MVIELSPRLYEETTLFLTYQAQESKALFRLYDSEKLLILTRNIDSFNQNIVHVFQCYLYQILLNLKKIWTPQRFELSEVLVIVVAFQTLIFQLLSNDGECVLGIFIHTYMLGPVKLEFPVSISIALTCNGRTNKLSHLGG